MMNIGAFGKSSAMKQCQDRGIHPVHTSSVNWIGKDEPMEGRGGLGGHECQTGREDVLKEQKREGSNNVPFSICIANMPL